MPKAGNARPNAFAQLWDATEAFYKLFDIMPPQMSAARKKLKEEHKEAQYEAKLIAYNHPAQDANKLALELADVIVTGMAMAAGITREQMEAAMDEVSAKNAAKDHDRYHKVNGMVVKREVVADE